MDGAPQQLSLHLPESEISSSNMALAADFLYEIGAGRFTERSWSKSIGVKTANVAEHTFRVTHIAMWLAAQEGANIDRVASLCTIHDAPEIRGAELTPFQKAYVTFNEDKALKDMVNGLPHAAYLVELVKEYKDRQTLESRVVKDADILDTVLELIELAARGCNYLNSDETQTQIQIKAERYFTPSARALHAYVLAQPLANIWRWFQKGESTFKTGEYGK